MLCPSFRVSKYGLFDSSTRDLPPVSSERRLTEYELEFFSDSYSGATWSDDMEHALPRGTVLCLKPGQWRHSRFPFRCYYVHLTTDDPALDGLLRRLPDASFLPYMEAAVSIFQELLVLDSVSDPTAHLALQSGVCRLIRLIERAGQPAPHSRGHLDVMLGAERYIHVHLAEPLPLEAVAAAVNLSPSYFHRLFTAFFGRTPAQYILDLRIANAKLELLKESCSLPALVEECGFSSQSYFCYKFKQATGKTPLQYRRETLSQLNC